MADLPRVIPIFPLPNLVLFPGIKVPLHIFEPRYREMVADVAESHGVIGMMLLKGDWQRDYHAYPDIFEIGCAGRVDGLVQLDDGRYNIVLEGLSEFRIVNEVHRRSFREAQVEWRPVAGSDLEVDDEGMEALRELLLGYLGEPAHHAWRTLVGERGLHGGGLVNFLSFHLDLTPLEKQTLLEAMSRRVDCLFDVLTFKLQERKLGGSGGPRGGSETIQ